MRKLIFGLQISFVALSFVIATDALAEYYSKSYALVIGVDRYPTPKWPDLTYARDDAEAVARFLKNQGFQVIELYDQQANKNAIIEKMQNYLARVVRKNDRVLVFFAGHGYTEELAGEDWGYIVPYHIRAQTSAGYISMEELQTLSKKMGKAKHQLLIMASCYGGLLGKTRGGGVDPNIPNYLAEVTKRKARLIITAGGKDQEVVDGGPRELSVFTGHLIEALQDGLADTNGDGYITYSELASYLVPIASNAYQTPAPGTLPGHGMGEFVFRSPRGAIRPLENTFEKSGVLTRGQSALFAKQHRQTAIVPQVISIGKKILSNLDKTRNTGADFDYWPNGGIQIAYYHLATFVSYEMLVKLSPYPIFVSGPHGTDKLNLDAPFSFGHYNPEFLRWFHDHLINILQDDAFIHPTKKLFEKYLGETAMTYFATYNILNEHPKELNALLQDYKTRIDNRTLPEMYYYNIAWEGEKHFQSLKNLYATYDANVVAPAVYFWLRRHIDGTHQEIFSILESLLGAYRMIN